MATTVFRLSEEAQHLHFCSWKCVFLKLPQIKSDYFINLPLLNFDIKTKGMRGEDFFKAMREFK